MCLIMPKAAECVCCNDNDDIVQKMEDRECIVFHDCFQTTVLNEESINLLREEFFVHEKNASKKNKLAEDFSNTSWRYLAYRYFVRWINSWVSMGKRNRIPLPSFVVNAIKEKWPEKSGVYKGFLDVENDEDDDGVPN